MGELKCWILFIFLIKLLEATQYTKYIWINVSGVALVHQQKCQTKIECGAFCSQNPDCGGFLTSQGICYMFNVLEIGGDTYQMYTSENRITEIENQPLVTPHLLIIGGSTKELWSYFYYYSDWNSNDLDIRYSDYDYYSPVDSAGDYQYIDIDYEKGVLFNLADPK